MPIAFRNATSTALTSGTTSTSIPIPSGVQAGDLLIAWVELGNIVSAFNNPAGWTQFGWSPVVDGVNSNAFAFWKIAAGGESPAAISWTTNSKGVLVTVAYSGVDTVSPLGANNVNIETTSQTTATTPTLTAVDAEWAVTVHSSRSSTTANKSPTWTAPSGEIQENATDNGAAAAAPWSAVVAFDSNGLVSVGSHSYTATSSFTESHHKSALIYITTGLPTPQPLVVTAPVLAPGPVPATLLRSSLADAIVAAATTAQPIVSAVGGQPAPVPTALIVRGPGAPVVAPTASTPAPLVVAPPPATPSIPPPLLRRAGLADPASATPLVVTTSGVAAPVARATLVRGSLVDPPTSRPLIVSTPAPASPVPVATLIRGSLVDPATPQPLVVTSPTQPAMGVATIVRSPATPLAGIQPSGTQPIVATWQPGPTVPARALLTSSATAPAVMPVATPAPIVVTTTATAYVPVPVLVRAAAPGVEPCEVIRPSAGVVARPSAGVVARATALVIRPVAGTVTRPGVGDVDRPGCR